MKQRVKKCGWSLLRIFVALLVTCATAFAQDTGKNPTSCAPVESRENTDTNTSPMKVAESELDTKYMELLKELLQPDSTDLAGRSGKEEIAACMDAL